MICPGSNQPGHLLTATRQIFCTVCGKLWPKVGDDEQQPVPRHTRPDQPT